MLVQNKKNAITKNWMKSTYATKWNCYEIIEKK